MIRLHVPHDLAAGAALALDEGKSRYLGAVMRVAVGGELLVFNGRDGEWRAAVAAVGKRAVTLEVRALERPQAVGPDLVLIVAVIKRGPLETIIEKATELGVRSILLAITDRTTTHQVRMDRLVAIATEAAEQTGRLDVPLIEQPMKLDRMLGRGLGRPILFCDEAGEADAIPDALYGRARGEPWAILIGPEGGFSPAERMKLREGEGAVPVSLGPRILRADTAAISALTLWQAALGDWTSR